MMKLKDKGLQMIAFFGVFAKESVSIRCNEIKNMLKDFEAKLEARKQLLEVSLDVFNCLDQVRTLVYVATLSSADVDKNFIFY